MLTAIARSTRALIGASVAAAVLALYTGCGDQSTERKGDDPPDLNAGAAGGGAAEGGGAGAQAGKTVPWCDAYKIVNCVCQQCHQDPVQHGASMPLMTYEDTQAPFPFPTSKTFVWEKMQAAVSSRFMPLTSDPTVTPPVEPLSDADRNTLLDWFAQGARDEGGTDCASTCDWSKGAP